MPPEKIIESDDELDEPDGDDSTVEPPEEEPED